MKSSPAPSAVLRLVATKARRPGQHRAGAGRGEEAGHAAHEERAGQARRRRPSQPLREPLGEGELEGAEHAGREHQQEHGQPDAPPPASRAAAPNAAPVRAATTPSVAKTTPHAHHVGRGEEHRLASARLRAARAEDADGDGDERVDARGERGEQPAEEDHQRAGAEAGPPRGTRRRRGWPRARWAGAAGTSASAERGQPQRPEARRTSGEGVHGGFECSPGSKTLSLLDSRAGNAHRGRGLPRCRGSVVIIDQSGPHCSQCRHGPNDR